MVAYTDKLIGKLIAKLEELKLRDNTLVLILGDNGTGKGTPSRFQGRDVVGGKGTSTHVGHPCSRHRQLARPLRQRQGLQRPDRCDGLSPHDLRGRGVKVPAELKIDGRSFLPQLRGEKGNPREALRLVQPRRWADGASSSSRTMPAYKLYADGKFFNVAKDDLEKSPLADPRSDDTAKAAKAKLQALLKQFEGPRPERFVKQYQNRPKKQTIRWITDMARPVRISRRTRKTSNRSERKKSK